MDTRISRLPFDSFAYSKSIWVLNIHQAPNINNSIIFTGQRSIDVNLDYSGFNNDSVTTLIIGTGVAELNAWNDHTDYLQQTIRNSEKVFANLKNIYIFYTTIYLEPDRLHSQKNLNIIHLPYFLLRSGMTDITQFNDWNIGNKRAMCLPGDVRNRFHKFPIIYYFYEKNDLNTLQYSLIRHDSGELLDHHEYIRQLINNIFLKNYDKNSFDVMYDSLCRQFPNDTYPHLADYHGLDVSTYVYPECWDEATCNLILECCYTDLKEYLDYEYTFQKPVKKIYEDFFLSEKVWKPILSGKPFIALSFEDKIYTKLEELGFKTFLNYTAHPEKVSIASDIKRIEISKTLLLHLDLCYNRVKSFIANVESNKNSIIEDINFNQNRWKELVDLEWQKLYNECPVVKNVDKKLFCEFFNHGLAFGLYTEWYNRE